MITHENENRLITQAVKWAGKASESILEAGGSVPAMLNMFPEELLSTLVRNGLGLTYDGPKAGRRI